MYSDESRKVPKSTAEAASIITKPPPTPRSARRWICSSGWAVCISIRAKATRPRMPAPPIPRVCSEVQPALVACERAKTIAARLPVARTAPRRSSPRHWGRAASAGTILIVVTARARPTGTLIRKIACQPMSEVSAPPRSTPTAAPAPPTAPQAPSARARSWPSVNVAMMIERAAGESIAAPSPWPARAANKAVALAARAEATDAAVKTPRPVRNMRLRPMRSAARPPSRSRLPKISE